MAAQLRLQAIDATALRLLLDRPADVARARTWLRQHGVAGWALRAHDLRAAAALSRDARRLGIAVALTLTLGDGEGSETPAAGQFDGVPLVVLRPSPSLPDLSAAAAEISRWLALRRDLGTHWALDGWPRCLALPQGDVAVAIDGLAAVPASATEGRTKPRPSAVRPAEPTELRGADVPEPCWHCALAANCPGWPTWAAGLPVRPLVAVSNQADLIEDVGAVIAWHGADADPGSESTAGSAAQTHGDGAPARQRLELALHPEELEGVAASVLLQDPEHVQRYTCRDPAFRPGGAATPMGLQRELATRGQLWLDVSIKERLDDFGADLAPLRQLQPGVTLQDGRWLPPVWRRDSGIAPFAAEEQRLRDRIAALRGTVIDVGAGPLRYLQVIAPAIASGLLRYIAIEPDGGALAALRQALPGAVLARGIGEALPLPDRCADVVMVLRAWNHLSAPLAMLAEAQRVLRPQGALILVDNVAFGLLRSASAAARAHAISVDVTPFEHFRNDDAAAAIAWLDRAGGFQVVERQDVAPGTGNQWFVRAVYGGR